MASSRNPLGIDNGQGPFVSVVGTFGSVHVRTGRKTAIIYMYVNYAGQIILFISTQVFHWCFLRKLQKQTDLSVSTMQQQKTV